MKLKEPLLWILQIIAAFILVQSLYYKFTGAPESVYIFTTLGMEPWGRFLIGFFELVAVIFLLVPRLSANGALLAFGLMLGAALAHLTKLGIVVFDDGGLLFGLSLVVLACSSIVAYARRANIWLIGKQMV